MKFLIDIAHRPLVRNVAKVATGNIAGNALNFIAVGLITVSLDALPLGLFVSLQAAMLFIAQFSDFGLNTTMIKYYRDMESEGSPVDAEALLRRMLWLRLAIAGLFAGTCIVFARPICGLWLKDPDAVGLFRLICVGALGSSVWMFCQASMQARQQFGWYAILTSGNHLVRLILVGVLVFMHRLNVSTAVYVIIAVPFVGALGGALLWPPDFWKARMDPAEMQRQTSRIWGMTKWIFLSTITCSLIMRLDIFLLRGMTNEGSVEVGILGAANNFAQAFPLITMAISTVLLPKIAATRERAEMLRIVRIFARAAPLLMVGVGLAIVAAHLFFPWIRGGEYEQSVWVFDLLVIGFSISVVVNPLSFFCLAFERPQWLTWMNLSQLILNVGIDVVLIPTLGALAAGVSTLSVRLFALIYLAFAFGRLLKMADRVTDSESPTARL